MLSNVLFLKAFSLHIIVKLGLFFAKFVKALIHRHHFSCTVRQQVTVSHHQVYLYKNHFLNPKTIKHHSMPPKSVHFSSLYLFRTTPFKQNDRRQL